VAEPSLASREDERERWTAARDHAARWRR